MSTAAIPYSRPRLALLAAAATALAMAGIARADDAAVAGLAAQLGADDRATLQSAIAALGAREEESALTVLSALEAGRLRIASSGQVLVRNEDRSFTDVSSGGKVANAPAGAREPLITNTLRRALETSIAQLQMRSKDAAIRMRAAEVVSADPAPEMAPAMRKALAAETEADIKAHFALGLAKLDLAAQDRALRLQAVKTLGAIADPATKPQLGRLVEKRSDGTFVEADAELREAAKTALSAIERHELFVRVARDLMYGMSLGSVLLLAALGLAITFGLMGVINMAHGEMLMFGAYATYTVQRVFQQYLPSALDWYLPAAVPIAFATCFLVGMAMERTVIRFLYGRPLETLLATWGISLGLIQTVRLVYGAQNVTVANPTWLSGGFDLMSGIVVPYTRIATIAFASLVMAGIWYLLNRTTLGLQVRAITQNRRMARCVGIRTARIDAMTFGIGSGVAGLGGVALSQIGNVGPELGQGYIVDSFMVVVVGGVGNLFGTLYAALGLGVINKLLEPVSGAVLGKILVLGLIILFIQRRPQGLFALKGRAAET